MASKESVSALLDRYLSAMNRKDRDAWVDCFADDASHEDPVGTAPNFGREAIGQFFEQVTQIPITVRSTSEPIIVGTEVLAFIEAEAEIEGQRIHMPRIVDHIVLTPDGTRIQALRAFFNPADGVPAGD